MGTGAGAAGTGGDLVVRGCDVLDVPQEGACTVLPDREVRIAGGRVVAVEPAGERRDDGVEVLDARGLLAVPGLRNAHCHSPMVLMRGTAEDMGLDDWFNTRIWPMEVNLTPERVLAGARLACAEMLLGGVTAFADHYFHAEQVADAAEELGIRADVAPTFFSSRGEVGRERAVEVALGLRERTSGLVTASLGPHATYTVTEADLEATARTATREGLPVHVHAAETLEQTRASVARTGATPVEVLERTGVLDAGALIAHGAGITAGDVGLLARHRDRVGVACCPKGFFKHAITPITPVRELLAAGVAVGCGTDGAALGGTLDVWEQARLTALASKRQTGDPAFLDVSTAVRLATRGGASLVARGGGQGHLGVGQPADLALVDLGGPHCQPLHDPVAALVYSVRASDVVTVVVAGRVVVRDRRLVRADLAEVVARAVAAAPGLLATQEGEAVQRYAP